MVGGSRRMAPAASKSAVQGTVSVKEGNGDDSVVVLDDSSPESDVKKLRGRWELASVLNFLSVFEPVIGSCLKLTAEEIEMGLIERNSSNAQLHIALLKGIPPVSKTLNDSDAWVTVLCKKLATWWQWVADGDSLLTACKGEEIARYKELVPTHRLLILKALCEIRAEQDDAVSYINDTLKQGIQISSFRKEKIGGDGNGTSYWYDGNSILGYRLYREVNKTESKTKMRGKACLTLPAVCFLWETVATNLEEFRKVSSELTSSKVVAEVAIGKAIETDAIPVIQKFQKKKERALKRKKTEEKLLSGLRNSYGGAGINRSCRNRRPISYTYDEFDRTIEEAIQLTKETRTFEEPMQKQKLQQEKVTSNGVSDMGTDSKDRSGKRGNSTDSETENDKLQEEGGNDGDEDDDDYDGKKDEEYESGSDTSNSDEEKDDSLDKRNHAATLILQKPKGSRWSKRLAGVTSHPVVETKNLGAKNMLRQRPTRNSAFESVVPDSDDEISSEHTNSGISGHENLCQLAEVSDS